MKKTVVGILLGFVLLFTGANKSEAACYYSFNGHTTKYACNNNFYAPTPTFGFSIVFPSGSFTVTDDYYFGNVVFSNGHYIRPIYRRPIAHHRPIRPPHHIAPPPSHHRPVAQRPHHKVIHPHRTIYKSVTVRTSGKKS